jgi:porin
MARDAPLSGGNNEGGFLYNGISAPPPGSVLPAYTFGAMLAGKAGQSKKLSYNLWLYDPNNAQGGDFWKDLFSDGVVINGTLTYETGFGGQPGFYGVNLVHSTADGVNFHSLLLPPGSEGFAATTKGISYTTLSFTQFLSHNPDKPSEGWGVFGQVGIGDGNPNFLDNSYIFGIGGNSILAGRSSDRWGVAYARYNWSNDLNEGLDALIGTRLNDEYVVEAYYEAKITDHLRLGANVMRVNPGLPDKKDYTQLGIRTSINF